MKKKHLYPRLLSLFAGLLLAAAATAQTYELEFWYDKYSNPQTTAFSGTKLKKSFNVKSLKQGFHTIYMRVKSSDGEYSPVTSSTFIKFAVSGESVIEYWFDKDVKNRATTPVDVSSGVVQLIDLDLSDDVRFPLGFHQLNMRVAAYGGHYSPVYSAYVTKVPVGQASEITYWLDDDYENRRVVMGLHGLGSYANTTWFRTSLDFSSAPVGMHRLKCRITRNGFDDGPIYETPVLITKKYNSAGEVTIVSESRWIDEASPAEISVSRPQELYTKSYVLDPKAYTVGQHAFHVQYKNSADVWGEENITYFYKDEQGRLMPGLWRGEATAVEESEGTEHFVCTYSGGKIFVDCQSAKLASTGVVIVCDLTGKVIARQTVNNADGIHAELNVEGYSHRLVIVKLVSGGVNHTKKLRIGK